MTLKAIEIWNLNKFKGTYKHKKIKNQKQKKREFFKARIHGEIFLSKDFMKCVFHDSFIV